METDPFTEFLRYSHETDTPEANLRRAEHLGFGGRQIRVAPGAIIRLHAGGAIGDHCFIGLYGYVNGEVLLEDHVIIGPYCSITSNTHCFDPATQAFTGRRSAPIRIGRGTWLCAGVSVTAGVTVGRGNLVCAHAVVTHPTPDFAIMAGVPARQVGSIDPETGESQWKQKA